MLPGASLLRLYFTVADPVRPDRLRSATLVDTPPSAITDHPDSPWPRVAFNVQCLDFAILAAATISVLTNQSWRWIDLRFVGFYAQIWLPAAWVVSLLILRLVRQVPAPAARTFTAGDLKRRGTLATLALLPSWLIAAVLVVNTIYFYHLRTLPDFDPSDPLPCCLYVLLVLLRWLAARPDRYLLMPQKADAPPIAPPRHWQIAADSLASTVFALGWTGLMLYLFLFAFHADPPPPGVTADVGVVFGNNTLPGDVCGRALRYRTLEAIHLYQHGVIRHLILSGAAPNGPAASSKNEPLAMLKLCLAHHLPPRAIILDFHGNNTRYSCYNARRIMLAHHWKTVVGISSDYHLPRIRLAFAQNHIDAWTMAGHPVRWRQASLFALVRELVGYPVYWLDPHYHQPEPAP